MAPSMPSFMFPWREDAPAPYTHQEHEREMVAFILHLYINLSLSRDTEFQHPTGVGPLCDSSNMGCH